MIRVSDITVRRLKDGSYSLGMIAKKGTTIMDIAPFMDMPEAQISIPEQTEDEDTIKKKAGLFDRIADLVKSKIEELNNDSQL